MNVPKYIRDALVRRARAAERWNAADLLISEYIDKHGIDVETCDYHGGVEGIVNPWDSIKRIYAAIKSHDEKPKS